MIPTIEHSSLLIILFWLLMIPIAVFVLIRTTAFWTEDGPGTIQSAVKTVLVMWLAVYLAYDLSGYLFACMMQDPQLGIAFPPHYSYWVWLREPMGLKWHVLGFIPMIRYLPVLFALCAGGVGQVLLWKVPFRVGVMVFLSQLLLNIFAMALLSLVFSFFIGVGEGSVEKGHPRNRSGKPATARAAAATDPGGLQGMQQRIESLGMQEGPLVRRLWGRWKSVNLLQPATSHLPLPLQDFLNGGGWLLLIPGAIAAARFRTGGGPRQPLEKEPR